MSLDFNFGDVRDHELLHADEDQWQLTQGLIWGCLLTGIGRITEEDVPEIHARLTLAARLGTHLIAGQDGPYEITVADVRRRVGLTTNVFPRETTAKWLKRIAGGALTDLQRAAQAELAREQVPA